MIDLDLLCQKRPFLYHLTSRVNIPSIVRSRGLLSASVLLERADDPAALAHLRRRRPDHVTIEIEGREVMIRDQRPISEKALAKCLDGDLQPADYYELLNHRVFLWPTLKRLARHYDRYKSEEPVLLRFSTREILALNPRAEFSRLNSGATRANSYLGGIAPRRGRETFQTAEACDCGISAIAEVTIPRSCVLPERFHSADDPDGPWSSID